MLHQKKNLILVYCVLKTEHLAIRPMSLPHCAVVFVGVLKGSQPPSLAKCNKQKLLAPDGIVRAVFCQRGALGTNLPTGP